MFNIGFAELMLILLVAFVVVGPRDLPKIAASLGRGVRTIKKFLQEFQDETGIGEAVDEFKKTSRDLERTVRQADPTRELKQAQKDVEDAVRSTADAAKKVLETENKP